MGPKQSSPSVGVRVRSYSGSDMNSADARAAVLRYYAGGSTGQIGERVQYSSHIPASFTQSAIIPTSGRRDEPDGQRTLMIGSLPAHLTPHMLGAGFDCPVCSKTLVSVRYVWMTWFRGTPLLDCPVSASTTKGVLMNGLRSTGRVQNIPQTDIKQIFPVKKNSRKGLS